MWIFRSLYGWGDSTDCRGRRKERMNRNKVRALGDHLADVSVRAVTL